MEHVRAREAAINAVTSWSTRRAAGSQAVGPDATALREQRFFRRPDALAASGKRLQDHPRDHQARRTAGLLGRRRGGLGHEGMGARAGCDPLHPLVPADDRPDRREARFVPGTHRGGRGRSPSSAARS